MIEVLERHGNEYFVRNSQNNNHYVVCLNHPDVKMRCECADCFFRGIQFKKAGGRRQEAGGIPINKFRGFNTDAVFLALRVSKYMFLCFS